MKATDTGSHYPLVVINTSDILVWDNLPCYTPPSIITYESAEVLDEV